MQTTFQRILLLDDEPSVVRALALLLQAIGFSVKDFCVPEEAVTFLEQEDCTDLDLMLCDLKMPGMNGFDVLRKASAVAPDLPCVLMSAHASEEDVNQAKALGAVGFLAKPFTPDDFFQLLQTIEREASLASNQS